MSHHIYQTEAFVIDSRPSGEANKIVYLFTKDLGLVVAAAQGVRLLKSKLRYSLQDFSYSKVSLVRGKEMWRLTSAGLVEKLLAKMSPDSFAFARGLSLVKRLVQGEEKNEALFETLRHAADFLSSREIDQASPEAFEQLLVLRILHTLGYVSLHSFTAFLDNSEWSLPLLERVESERKDIISAINKALTESQL